MLKETRVYQEAKADGITKGKAELVLRLLHRRLGNIPKRTTTKNQKLSIAHLEELAEALLDFTHPQDLTDWLASH